MSYCLCDFFSRSLPSRSFVSFFVLRLVARSVAYHLLCVSMWHFVFFSFLLISNIQAVFVAISFLPSGNFPLSFKLHIMFINFINKTNKRNTNDANKSNQTERQLILYKMKNEQVFVEKIRNFHNKCWQWIWQLNWKWVDILSMRFNFCPCSRLKRNVPTVS